MARIKFSSHENSGLSAYLSTLLNLSHPIPRRREKIKFNFCFHTSLQYLKRFYEDLKGLTLWIKPHYVIPKNQYSEMYFCFWNDFVSAYIINPLSTNPTKWWNTLKQFVGKLPTNCFSVWPFCGGWNLRVNLNRLMKAVRYCWMV